MSFDYFSSLDQEAKLRYVRKLNAIKMTECPYRLPADAWKNDPTKWSDVEYPDIFDYLINEPGEYKVF